METKQLVEELRVVTLLADNTHGVPEIEAWLDRFQSISVPLTVIFPGAAPEKPILLRDVYTKSRLLESLRKAGPSVGVGSQASRATAERR